MWNKTILRHGVTLWWNQIWLNQPCASYHQSNLFSYFAHIICASRSILFTVYYVPVDLGWWSHIQCICSSSHTFGVGQFIQRDQLTVDISDGLNNSLWECMHTVSPKLMLVWFIYFQKSFFWVDLESDSIKVGYSLDYRLYSKLDHVISLKMDKLCVITCQYVGYDIFEEEISKFDQ